MKLALDEPCRKNDHPANQMTPGAVVKYENARGVIYFNKICRCRDKVNAKSQSKEAVSGDKSEVGLRT